MSNLYKVSINVDSVYGHIVYDEQTKQITVEFPDEKVKEAVQKYLQQPHLINEAKRPSTCEFVEHEYFAQNSKDDLQVVLSRMYDHLQVHVNWSIPPEIDMNNI